MKKILILLSLCVFVFGSYAQSKKVYKLRTPKDAVKLHLDNVTIRNDVDAALQAFDWTDSKLTDKQKYDIARHLLQIFDGEGFEVNTDKISDNPNYVDSSSHGEYIFHVMPQYPNIYLLRSEKDSLWRYSAKTVASIPKIYKRVYPMGLHHFADYFQKNFKNQYKILGLKIYQLIGLLIILIVLFLFHKILTFLFQKFILFVLARLAKAKLAVKYIVPVAKPLSLLMVFYIAMLLVPVLQLPIKAGAYVIVSLKASIPFFAMIVVYKLVDILIAYLEKLAEKTDSTLDDQLVPLLRKALKVFVIIVGILFILANFNFDITALLAGLSVGGLALALAAQDLLKNFFGSIMIFMDRPFQVGDWVTASGIDGDIEEVGFRATRIRTFHNSVTYVPNGKLADMVVDNMGMRRYRRYKTMISITYDTAPEIMDVYVEGLRKIVENHPNTRKDSYHVYVNSFAGSSIDILFYIFFEVPDWGQELKARHEVNLAIVKLADQLGVRFAFPTQTVHVEDFPEKKSLTPEPTNDTQDALRGKVDKFIAEEYQSK